MKRLALSVLMLISVISAVAQWRSAEEASALASSFLKHNPAGLHKAPATAKPELVFVKKLAGKPLVYAFDLAGEDGYVLVSGNENSRVDVLGYADKGRFDEKSMSDGMKWLLESYVQEIALLDELNATPLPRKVATRASRTDVTPLIQTRWGQGDPFNRLCPAGTLTGCVATAISQLGYYYQYPTKGTGEHSYLWKSGDQTLSANFAATTYKWDKMKHEYRYTPYTQDEALAVATIASHVGIAIEANYGTGATSGSYTDAVKALHEYFGYGDAMYFAQRANYTDEDWEELVWAELDRQSPVLYEGNGGAGGHAFIVDGYLDGLFHVNWGWEGDDDGYFYLSSLVPSSYAMYGGFTKNQNAYFSVRPADGSASSQRAESYKNWTISSSFAKPTSTVSITGNLMNCGVVPEKFAISAIAVDKNDGSVTMLLKSRNLPYSINMSSYYSVKLEFSVSSLQVGHTYTISPIILTPDKGADTYYVLPMPVDAQPMELEIIEEGQSVTNGEEYPRRMVTEQLTSTQYGNGGSVLGIVSADYMKTKYPDNFININVHYLDEMDMYANFKYFLDLSSIPAMRVNRLFVSTSVAVAEMEKMIAESGMKAGEMVKVDGMEVLNNSVKVTSHARFNHDVSRADYRLLYVILEDNVGPYMQKNGYSGSRNDVGGWEKLGSQVSVLLNDVARSIYPSMTGVAGAIPSNLEAGENYRVTTTVPLPDNIQDRSNLSMVVMLYDALKGEILNADKITIANHADAIRDVKTTQDAMYFSVGGQKLSQPQQGVNIMRAADGQVRKILVR